MATNSRRRNVIVNEAGDRASNGQEIESCLNARNGMITHAVAVGNEHLLRRLVHLHIPAIPTIPRHYVAHIKAPERVVTNDKGEITGVEAVEEKATHARP